VLLNPMSGWNGGADVAIGRNTSSQTTNKARGSPIRANKGNARLNSDPKRGCL
jgi:hypothetical protein